jgi:hypothetical protein
LLQGLAVCCVLLGFRTEHRAHRAVNQKVGQACESQPLLEGSWVQVGVGKRLAGQRGQGLGYVAVAVGAVDRQVDDEEYRIVC